jgi:VIT1/CCC1 family predicted Fe2+/Mn2+ transporter
MENSIEAIWKEGFLDEKSLVAPKINDLYHQKSRHLVDRMKRMFRVNFNILIIMAIVFPVVYYFIDALWQGVAASVLLLLTAWYNKRQIDSISTLDQGATSLDYLKSLSLWHKDVVLKGEKIARLSYPLYLLIGLNTIWSAWEKEDMTSKVAENFSGLVSTANIQFFSLAIGAVMILLMLAFSPKIYKWDVRLMYGRIFRKLEETIAEMEELKQGQ